MKRMLSNLLCLGLLCVAAASHADQPIRVASKNFNESYILGELIALTLEAEGFEVERRFGLGGTLICFTALTGDEIDVYAEYTGTLAQAILNLTETNASIEALNAEVAPAGIEMLPGFGFNNTYAFVTTGTLAEDLGLSRVSDLAAHPDLRLVLSHEFLEREDGWPGVQTTYGLTHAVRGIEHALAYQALADGAIDVTDAYSTDGEVERYGLAVLEDDRGFFPRYLAAPLARQVLPQRAKTALMRLAGSIDDRAMQAMNAAVVFEQRSFREVAAAHLETLGVQVDEQADAAWADLLGNVVRHLQLTGMALGLAVVVGLGLSLATYRYATASRVVLYVCGLMQTVPSIALLALMIPLFGIGMVPAVLALFLYSLLPIVRNTLTALTTVDPVLVRVATSMGLNPREQLRHLLLPLATPAIFAGVRTAAVISIGTATLAAFIGAGRARRSDRDRAVSQRHLADSAGRGAGGTVGGCHRACLRSP